MTKKPEQKRMMRIILRAGGICSLRRMGMGIIITRRSELLVLFYLVFRFCKGFFVWGLGGLTRRLGRRLPRRDLCGGYIFLGERCGLVLLFLSVSCLSVSCLKKVVGLTSRIWPNLPVLGDWSAHADMSQQTSQICNGTECRSKIDSTTSRSAGTGSSAG